MNNTTEIDGPGHGPQECRTVRVQLPDGRVVDALNLTHCGPDIEVQMPSFLADRFEDDEEVPR